MKHCFKKFMALLLATLMVMSSFSTIAVFAQTDDCKHEANKWSVWAVNGVSTVAPTCTEPGYTWYRCECGEVEARDFVPKLGHDLKWTAESVEDVACGELYAIYLGCTRCNYVEEWAPTTNVPGYKTHSYTTYELVEAPTCLTYGELVLICDNKDHDGAECPEIPVLIQRLNGNKGEHKFDKLVRRVDPTCTDNGYELYECSLCYVKTGVKALGEDNAETSTKVINKLGHDLYKDDTNVYNYVADNSCEVKCERCDHTETIHASLTKNRKVTGTKPGSELSCYTADYCDRCKWEGPKTAAHVIDKAKTTTRVDTVNHMCYTVYTCVDCEYVWEVAAVPGKDGGHKIYNEEGYVAPTCTEYGKVTWACLACGANGLEMLDMREHYLDTTKDLIVDGVKKADKATKEVITAGCERDGGTYVTCGYADCDYRTLVEGTFVAATGHNKVVDKVTPATCISPEIKTYKCANGCGKVYAPEYVGTPIPNAHPSECYEVTTAPTCTAQGIATLYCTLCSAKDQWIEYGDKDAKDDAGNALYPNFDFSKLLAFDHTFTNAHVSLLLTIAPNKDNDPKNDLTVGSSALYEADYQAPTCTTDGFRKGSCYICNVKVNEVLPKGHSSENGYHDQHAVAAGWYLGGYLTYDQAGNVTGSYLRLPNGDHEALEWYYCSACETNWTDKGEKGAHDDWYDGIKADKTLGIEFVKKVDAECGKNGTYAHWIIPCNKVFQEIKKVVALPVKDNKGNIVRYDFDLNNDGAVDGTIGVDGTASGKVNAIGWAVDADGYVRDENGYFEWYLVDVECHHVSVVYVDDNGAPIVDAKGNRITDGTIPALLHDWDEVDSKGKPAPNKRGYVAGFAADCTNDGVKKHWICGKCGVAYDAAGYSYEDVNNDGKLDDADWKIPALGHNMIDVEEKKATCTKPGYSAHKACDRKGCTYTEGKTDYQALGHTVPTVVNQDNYCAHGVKAPTCVETGFGYGVLCSVCGECAGDQYHTVIPALGHQYVDLTTNLAPTCTDPYFSISFCAICGHFENCAKADKAKFEEKTPACVLADTTPATFNSLNALTQNVYGANYHSLTSYKYETVKVTYSFKANENLKKLFAKAGANYTLDLIVNGKVVASQKLEYTTSAKTLAFELLNVVDNFSFAVNSTNSTLLAATGSIKVQFIAEKTYGNREITNFKYWTEHTIQEGLKKPLEGNTYVADCVGYVQYTGCTVPGCGYIVEGSEQTVAGIGHDVADHKETVVTDKKLKCAICKRYVDAHENKYVITDMPSYIEPAQGDKAATHHVTTKYVLMACTECEFRTIEVDSVVEAEHSFSYKSTKVPATLTEGGIDIHACACGLEKDVPTAQLDGTYLELEIDNANKPGAGFTDSSIVAVTVKLSAADIAIWGINFRLTYDARYVEYIDGEEVWQSEDFKYGNSAVDVENTFAANHTGAKTNWVIVTAQAPNGADSKTQNIVVSGEQAFVTLYFKVNTPNNVDDVVFGFEKVDVINNGFVQDVDDGELVFDADGNPVYISQKVSTKATANTIDIKKYMDHTGEGTVDLLDCLAAYQIYSGEILVPGDYSVTIDVNKDGVVDLVDFMAIYDYISGKISYEDIRNLKA